MRYMKGFVVVALAAVAMAGNGISAKAAVAAGVVAADSLNVRKTASVASPIVGQLLSGDKVDIINRDGEWYQVEYGAEDKRERRYVHADYIKLASREVADEYAAEREIARKKEADRLAKIEAERKAAEEKREAEEKARKQKEEEKNKTSTTKNTKKTSSTEKTAKTENKSPSSSSSSRSGSVISYARGFLGVPYKYGGTSPKGFDCSGFTQYVYKNFGVYLSRTSSAQSGDGSRVSKGDLKTGDLVFFKSGGSGIGHVGIYISGGNFIHASSPGNDVKIDTLNSGYYAKNYVTARRVL